MSSARDAALAQRQQALLIRSGELRVAIAYQAQPIVGPLAFADRVGRLVRAAGDWAVANPLWVVAGVAGFALARPRRAWRWARRGWSVWRLVRLAAAFVPR